jgi:hypothetical protein
MRTLVQDFTAAAQQSDTIDVSDTPYSKFALQVIPTGVISAWTVVLEGSIDGNTFTPILTHTHLIGSNITIWPSAPAPVLYYRIKCSALTLGLGTKITANLLADR